MIGAHATTEDNPLLPRRVAVRVPLPITVDYTYCVPMDMAVADGAVVRVPVGGRMLWGAVWAAADDTAPAAKLKPISAVADVPPLSAALRRFVDWVAEYTLSPPGMVLRMVLSVLAALEPSPSVTGVIRAADWPEGVRKTPARQRLWAMLEGRGPVPVAEAARLAEVGDGAVRGLLAEGGLIAAPLPAPEVFTVPDADAACPVLGPEQSEAAAALRSAVGAGFGVTLLDGVTGSGKTEVYFEAVTEVLRRGGQALVLVPEIALTGQWLERFRARFGVAPAVWHSGLTPAQRRDTWRAVARGAARVLIGARSGLFLPFADLQLIVVDEEHEQAFKQEEGVLYHGRDMAVVRGSIEEIPVVLASATPSLETLANAKAGRYRTLTLPRRHGGAEMPTVDLVDLRLHPPETGPNGRNWLAPPLVAAMAETLEKGEQVLLYLNRRGYAPLTLCRHCGHRMQCPQCTAWLVEHRDGRPRLQCHHCGHAERLPDACPSCGATESFVACGPGVERIAEEVAARFPEARRLILASDQFSGAAGAAAALDLIGAREVDVIVGTQMVAKGHHFPGLTLVGVVDADVGLAGGDLRAAERTFQLLHQVAGRAGRGSLKGRVMMQTFDPAQPVIAALAAGDRDAFVAAEQIGRKALGMPPFGRLAAVIVAAKDDAMAASVARDLGRAFPGGEGLRLYGPAPAILSRLRGWSRHRLLVSAPRDVRIQALIRAWLARVAIPRAVRVRLDVDPYSFL